MVLKLETMFDIVIAWYHASENNIENSNLVTCNGPKQPLSNGWSKWVVCGGKAHNITFSAAAALITSGQKCEE